MYKLRENVLNELACPLVYHVALSSHNCAEITCVSCLLETGARLRGALPIDAALRCGAEGVYTCPELHSGNSACANQKAAYDSIVGLGLGGAIAPGYRGFI